MQVKADVNCITIHAVLIVLIQDNHAHNYTLFNIGRKSFIQWAIWIYYHLSVLQNDFQSQCVPSEDKLTCVKGVYHFLFIWETRMFHLVHNHITLGLFKAIKAQLAGHFL